MGKLFNKLSLAVFSGAVTLVPALTFADTVNKTQNGTPTGLQPVTGVGQNLDIVDVLIKVIYWILGFAAAIAVLFLILGGLQFVTSAGNTDRVTKAKQTILYSVIGIVVIVLSFVIVLFINNSLQKAAVN